MRENQQNLLMTIYALIGKIGIDEPKALGLDTSMVVVERVPLIINHCNRSIRRITQIVENRQFAFTLLSIVVRVIYTNV